MNEILIRQFLGKPKQSFVSNATLEQMIQFVHLKHDNKRDTPHAARDLSNL